MITFNSESQASTVVLSFPNMSPIPDGGVRQINFFARIGRDSYWKSEQYGSKRHDYFHGVELPC